MSENHSAHTHNYQTAFENELQELECSHEKLVACLTEKKGMERFLSQSTLEMIRNVRGKDEISVQGELRDVVVMFTDVRGFTRFSEVFAVKQVFEILNAYLSVQSENIRRYNGVLDKFLGDGIMAIFEGEEKESRALRAAIMIQNSVRELNYTYTKRAVLNVGIGIHTGQVFMGVLGETGRQDYTAIGDNVNIASRLCSSAKEGEILFTEEFKARLSQPDGIRFKDVMTVKGKKNSLNVYYYELDVCYSDFAQSKGIPRYDIRATNRKDEPHAHIRAVRAQAEQTGTVLTQKEKELIAVGASIVSGCQQCADYHFVKVFEEGATVEEVKETVRIASDMITYAGKVMQNKAYSLMNIPSHRFVTEDTPIEGDRLSILVRIGAAVALNCIPGIVHYLQIARTRGVGDEEIQMTTALAKIVAAKAREFAEDSILKSLDMVSHKQRDSGTGCNL